MKYSTMFHMTNDSGLFRTRAELEEREGAWPVGGNRFGSPSGDWVPLYEGKMVQAFDHRAANIVVNLKNQHRPAQPVPGHPRAAPGPERGYRTRSSGFPLRNAAGPLGWSGFSALKRLRHLQMSGH